MWKYFVVACLLTLVSGPVSAKQWCFDGSNCTCANYAKDNGWANFGGLVLARNWYGAAAGKGYVTGQVPRKGAAMIFEAWPTNSAGHVAIVESVVSSSEILVNHANWIENVVELRVSVKDVSASKNWSKVSVKGSNTGYPVLGFIYPRGTSDSSEFCDLRSAKCDIRVNGNIGWFPPINNCRNANQWYLIGYDSDGAAYPRGTIGPEACDQLQACYQ